MIGSTVGQLLVAGASAAAIEKTRGDRLRGLPGSAALALGGAWLAARPGSAILRGVGVGVGMLGVFGVLARAGERFGLGDVNFGE